MMTNLWSTLKGVGNWFEYEGFTVGGLATFLDVPYSKSSEIEDHPSSEPEKEQFLLNYWITTHPAPSWMVVAEALYQLMRAEDVHQVLEVVRRKYLIGIYVYYYILEITIII